MGDLSRRRAVKNYRSRLAERGMTRFEVLGRKEDRELVRAFARRLAEEGPDAVDLRAAVNEKLADPRARKGGILEALRRSPLTDVDISVDRSSEPGREIDL